MKIIAALLASAVAITSPAAAQQVEPAQPTQTSGQQQEETPSEPHEGHDHHDADTIVVTGVRQLDILAGTQTMAGEELQREVRPQIGETLARLPGVSATSFSPGASRPVLRGFQGERIRVLTDGIGSIDASSTSADHAVTIDPLTAERIEVLHGPAVLLFGSQAIGGAVNVIDRRIPRSVPEEGVHADIVGVLGFAAEERSVGGAIDFALGGGLVAHLDGTFRKTADLRTGGYVLSRQLRREQEETAAEELEEGHAEEAAEGLELAGLRGEIPNSATEQKTLGGGLALIRDNFNIGGSVTRFETQYGVPGRPGAGHHHEEEPGHDGEEPGHEGEEEEGEEEHGAVPVSIDLEQTRYDLRGEYEFGDGFFESARLRIGAANYEHTEFEGEEVGTVFNSDGIEGRLELAQREQRGWSGASGIQYFTRDFEAIGPEAFVPPNQSRQLGLFTLQEVDLGSTSIEGAARYEHSNAEAQTLGLERSFNTFSAALGASYEVDPRTRIGLNLSRSERAPAAEELFANGPHIATQAFEIGDPDLDTEKSLGAEAYVRVQKAAFSFNVTAFANWFNDFIYQAETGEEEDELPVFRHRQRDATFYGFEAEATARLFEAAGFRFVADAVADYVRATIKDAGPVPRIPPLRLLGGIEAQSQRLDSRIEVEWSAEQDRVAAFETPTDSHTLVNASLAWRPFGKAREMQFVLSANNIFDVEARRHASFTKDFVPLPGRDVRLSARLDF